MSDIDLDRLGDLWRAEPDAEELRALHRAARKARDRGRLAAAFELTLAAAMIAGLLAIVLVNPQPRTAVAVAAVILLLLYTQVRQRRFRQIELRNLAGDTATILDQSIERLEARLKRTRLGLILMGPAAILGFILAFVLDLDGGGEILRDLWGQGRARTAALVATAILVGTTLVQSATGFRKSKQELRRLQELRSSYRREHAASEGEE